MVTPHVVQAITRALDHLLESGAERDRDKAAQMERMGAERLRKAVTELEREQKQPEK